MEGEEERREERAKAVGALWRMMERKTMSCRLPPVPVSGEVEAEDRELAPSDTPSANECARSPITVEREEASAVISESGSEEECVWYEERERPRGWGWLCGGVGAGSEAASSSSQTLFPSSPPRRGGGKYSLLFRALP